MYPGNTRRQTLPRWLYVALRPGLETNAVKHGIRPQGKRTVVTLYSSYYQAVFKVSTIKYAPAVFRIRARKLAREGHDIQQVRQDEWNIAYVPAEYIEAIGLDTIMPIRTIKILKTTRYRKLRPKPFQYNTPGADHGFRVSVDRCFLCHAPNVQYTFGKRIVVCSEWEPWQHIKSHALNGGVTWTEYSQDDTGITIQTTMEVVVGRDASAKITLPKEVTPASLIYRCTECQHENIIIGGFVNDRFSDKHCERCQVPQLVLEASSAAIQPPAPMKRSFWKFW